MDVHNTEAEYGHEIYCDATNHGPMRVGHSAARARVSWRWLDQAGIDLEGARKRAAESTTRLETESEEESDRDPERVAGGGNEEYQGASGSSGEEWSGAEDV